MQKNILMRILYSSTYPYMIPTTSRLLLTFWPCMYWIPYSNDSKGYLIWISLSNEFKLKIYRAFEFVEMLQNDTKIAKENTKWLIFIK